MEHPSSHTADCANQASRPAAKGGRVQLWEVKAGGIALVCRKWASSLGTKTSPLPVTC